MVITDETSLIEKLRRIEALHAGATTEGERIAAAEAKKRIQARLAELQASDPPIEYKFSLPDPWSRQVFNALARRYGLLPYRHRGQKQQTIMLRVSRRFVDQTLWPEFTAISKELRGYLQHITSRVIREVLDANDGEATEVAGTMGPGGGPKDGE